MCGIIGQISFSEIKTPLPSLEQLHHRGPDSKGEWTNLKGNIYLGHTRLAILDPTSAGYQPMVDHSGRFTIVFNGEIYNHLELRKLIPSIKWTGGSDTETFLELFSAYGLESLPLLKGMFAFSLHDNKDDSILLVRDRLGIKPLYISISENYLRFASEVRPLFSGNGPILTPAALSEYLAFGRMPSTDFIGENIESLPPGGWLIVKGENQISKGKWWPNPRFTKPQMKSQKDHIQRVKHLVTIAIEEHLISDVGVGAFLSGGIDSSIITLVAGKMLGQKLQTFTIGFPQQSYDERSIAKKVAQKSGSMHTEIEISPENCLKWVEEAVDKFDLPSVDAINTYIVSKAVRNEGLKVALSGLGGDELFGGYPSFKDIPWLQWTGILPEKYSRGLIKYMPQEIQNKLRGLTEYNTGALTSARRRLSSVETLASLGLKGGHPQIHPAPFGLDLMAQISWSEIQHYMIPMLLRDSDQMGMSVGLEIRIPFLDHQLVEEVLAIPQKFKKGRGIKPLLVKAFEADLPSEIYQRPKQGFSLPMRDWIKGPLAGFTEEGLELATDILDLTGRFNPKRQLELLDKGNVHWTRVWKWCILGHWLKNKKNCVELDFPSPELR